jgi:PAS domain S-box-containing protein
MLLAQRLSRAFSRLIVDAKIVGRGGGVPPRPFPIREACAISEALSSASAELASRDAALRESEARFRGTFENAAVGVAHVGLDGRWLAVNERLCELLGYTSAELQARTFMDMTHAEDLPSNRDNVGKVLSGIMPVYRTDKRYIRKDGSSIWTGLTVSLQRDRAGTPQYFIAIIRNITERKETQERQKFLMHELAHRVKNKLAIIQAMVRQTARGSTSVEDFQQRITDRIQGLAVSTDLLVAQNWTGASLAELVNRHVEPFSHDAARLICGGPEIRIDAEAAQALGLSLHELATNSVKHGAWSTPSGIVTIRWVVESDGTGALFLRLSWMERGGPVVTEPARKGFGQTVIQHMVAQRLSARVDIAFAPEGLSWTVHVPSTHFHRI